MGCMLDSGTSGFCMITIRNCSILKSSKNHEHIHIVRCGWYALQLDYTGANLAKSRNLQEFMLQAVPEAARPRQDWQEQAEASSSGRPDASPYAAARGLYRLYNQPELHVQVREPVSTYLTPSASSRLWSLTYLRISAGFGFTDMLHSRA